MISKEVSSISAQIPTSNGTRLNEFKRNAIHLGANPEQQRNKTTPSLQRLALKTGSVCETPTPAHQRELLPASAHHALKHKNIVPTATLTQRLQRLVPPPTRQTSSCPICSEIQKRHDQNAAWRNARGPQGTLVNAAQSST